MNIIKEAARIFVGVLFIFSGLIKVNDPVGTAIKLEEYFQVFAYDFAPFFEWFIPGVLFLSVVLSVLEVVLGVALLIGYQMRITAWAMLVLIVFFTFLTFYSAYFNKVTDCGCFGDAIKLTPWQSFYKDVILLILIVVIFWKRDTYSPILPIRISHIAMAADTLIFILIATYAIRHLPFIDFRSYAIGNNIPELMLPSGELKYEYVMEKDGKEYSFEQYPSDKSYTFKAMNVLNPEVQPKITDLAVWNDEGEYTDEMLQGQKLLLITHSIDKTTTKRNDQIRDLISGLRNLEVWSLTSSSGDEYEAFAKGAGWDVPYYYVDATVSKAIIRSSPGILLLNNGTVLGKWHHNDVPSRSEVARLLP